MAKALGCDWVEFDVRLTGDGVVVVCHDDALARTTDGRGRISKLGLAAIRMVDAGSWFGRGFAGERVPTLEETLILCRDLDLGANIEIKAERGRWRATAAAVAASLDRLRGRLPPILASSFLVPAVAEMARCAPDLPRGMLWRRLPRDWAAIAARLGCATIHASQSELSPNVAAEVRAAGYPLLAYTVNDPARALELLAWGVTSVFSDAPDIIGRATASDVAGAGWREFR